MAEAVSCTKKQQAPLQCPKRFQQVKAHCLRLFRPGFISCNGGSHTDSRINHGTSVVGWGRFSWARSHR